MQLCIFTFSNYQLCPCDTPLKVYFLWFFLQICFFWMARLHHNSNRLSRIMSGLWVPGWWVAGVQKFPRHTFCPLSLLLVLVRMCFCFVVVHSNASCKQAELILEEWSISISLTMFRFSLKSDQSLLFADVAFLYDRDMKGTWQCCPASPDVCTIWPGHIAVLRFQAFWQSLHRTRVALWSFARPRVLRIAASRLGIIGQLGHLGKTVIWPGLVGPKTPPIPHSIS